MFAGGFTSVAAALLLASTPAPAADPPAPSPQNLQLGLASSEDPGWELTRVELVLDGESIASIEVVESGGVIRTGISEAPARPLWSGQVAPGPHNLAALLFFRPRAPKAPGADPDVVRLETRWDRPIHPLVLLITPVRPAPAPAEMPPALQLSVSASEI